VRCKEVWVEGAARFCNPDEDLPQDFDVKRAAYYEALAQPPDSSVFVEHLRGKMDAALTALSATLPTNTKAKIITSKKKVACPSPPWRSNQSRPTSST
jgi:hypothetical protein